ncbi:MAG: hypothetical protein FJ308_14790 [Planctomycetes bacterium]|nr:hypothetical protein [Planctomycetota bacterium]
MARRRQHGPSVSFFAFQDIITSVVGIFVLITLIMMVDLVSRKGSSSTAGAAEDTLSSVISDMQSEIQDLQARSEYLFQRGKKVAGVQSLNKEEVKADMERRLQSLREQLQRAESKNREIEKSIDAQLAEQKRLQIESLKRAPEREELKKLLSKLEFLETKIGELSTEDPLVFKNVNLMGRTVVIVDLEPKKIFALDLASDQRIEFSGGARFSQFENWVKSRPLSKLHFFMLVRPGAASSHSKVQECLQDSNASFGFDLLQDGKTIKLRSEAKQ